MTITAEVICHSVAPRHDVRLWTLRLRYPRFIHAEFMTHRVFSRNASSSRAIPVAKLIQDVLDDTAMPIHWGKNQPGMQAREEHDAPVNVLIPCQIQSGTDYPGWGGMDFAECEHAPYLEQEATDPEGAWTCARDMAIHMARAFDAAGYHKQIVNRLLEPFSHINVVVTATEWDNFFALRDHPDAQPEIRVLAQEIKKAMAASTPRRVRVGEWHVPFVTDDEREFLTPEVLCKVSAARCARVSYLTHDQRLPDLAEDLALYNRLAAAEPAHASPFEHQATPINFPATTRNLRGWQSVRVQMDERAEARRRAAFTRGEDAGK